MAKLIVIRLVPSAPVDGATFTSYLQGLNLQAFALSFNQPTYTAGIAPTAQAAYNPADANMMNALEIDAPFAALPNYLSPPPAASYPANTGIAQHFDAASSIGGTAYFPIAVATAVFEVDMPPWPGNFENLHLVMTRGGETIPADTDHYVVSLDPGPLPTPDGFQGLQTTSFYVSLPPPPAAAGVGLSLPTDGSPPPFDQLLSAVQQVLLSDPGGAQPDLTQLSPAACNNIANEIIWSRKDPLPTPPESLESLYNNKPNTGSPSDQHEQDRKQFEGALASFYGTRNATAQKLGRYVYALAAACACEKLSLAQTQAIFEFPPDPQPAGSSATMDLVLTGLGGADPGTNNLGVPAAYFYVLGANLPPEITIAQRYQMACGDPTTRVLAAFASAFNTSTITSIEPFVTQPAAASHPVVNPAQAARRLTALSVASNSTAANTPLSAKLQPVLTAWLAFPASPAPPAIPTWPGYQPDDDAAFWLGEATGADGAAFLGFVLAALTRGFECPDGHLLADKIAAAQIAGAPMLAAQTVAALANVTLAQWTTFLQALGVDALPGFTRPGNAAARISAFILAVQQLFAPAVPGPPILAGVAGTPPLLPLPSQEWIAACLAIYNGLPGGGAVSFGDGFDSGVMATAAGRLFADDSAAQAWLVDALATIDALWKLVRAGTLANPSPIVIQAPQVDSQQLRFSLMEALYARGFTGPADIRPIGAEDFAQALTGTVAYDYAAAIYTAAGAQPPPPPPPGSFAPINPDGRLTDCIPAPCASPLEPVAYLAELLELSQAATCATPAAPPAAGQTTLADAVAGRRGPLQQMLASCANLQTPLPVIDIVNECLENVAANLPAAAVGAVYDTEAGMLGDHVLCERPRCDAEDSLAPAPDCHDPARLFAALAQYSSPATPVQQPGAYDRLRADFSAPCLPYSQPLDICRSYLCSLGTNRAQTMRVFRHRIAEYALDPALPDNVFQAHLWRYPLRLEIAVESTGLAPEEFAALFAGGGNIPAWQLHGFPSAAPGGKDWIQIATLVSEFLCRTGLNYCEFLDLWRSSLVAFSNAASADGSFPDCEPCYLDQLTIGFPLGVDPGGSLLRLAVFIRLWRALRRGCAGQTGLSFIQLADITQVLEPIAGGLNTEFVRQLAAVLLLHKDFEIPLADREVLPGATGADRTQILALWAGPASAKWDWAIEQLVEHTGAVPSGTFIASAGHPSSSSCCLRTSIRSPGSPASIQAPQLTPGMPDPPARCALPRCWRRSTPRISRSARSSICSPLTLTRPATTRSSCRTPTRRSGTPSACLSTATAMNSGNCATSCAAPTRTTRNSTAGHGRT